MAKVTVKIFGVLRVDTGLGTSEVQAERLDGIFDILNEKIELIFAERLKERPGLERPERLSFKDAIVYVNGERCTKKKAALNDGDEIWLLSPASGG